MKKNSMMVKSMLINILTVATFAFACTSCTNPMEDIAEGLVYGIADKIVDKKGQQEWEEKKKQESLDNLLNWNIGSWVDQEAIDRFGHEYCFVATAVPANYWDRVDMDSISSYGNLNDFYFVRRLDCSYATDGYSRQVGGIICNKLIANDLVYIFRTLYEANYVFLRSYDTIPVAQQHGMAVVMKTNKPLTNEDLAVRLFKEMGFTWGGDEPNGNTTYFVKKMPQ